jgi:Tfp pilus assembly protein PilV
MLVVACVLSMLLLLPTLRHTRAASQRREVTA